jgi:hypothetical protein
VIASITLISAPLKHSAYCMISAAAPIGVCGGQVRHHTRSRRRRPVAVSSLPKALCSSSKFISIEYLKLRGFQLTS